MPDRLALMLESMIVAVDDGLSYDGVVSVPEIGLEDFGRRRGLAGWLDGCMESYWRAKAAMSRRTTRGNELQLSQPQSSQHASSPPPRTPPPSDPPPPQDPPLPRDPPQAAPAGPSPSQTGLPRKKVTAIDSGPLSQAPAHSGKSTPLKDLSPRTSQPRKPTMPDSIFDTQLPRQRPRQVLGNQAGDQKSSQGKGGQAPAISDVVQNFPAPEEGEAASIDEGSTEQERLPRKKSFNLEGTKAKGKGGAD